MRPLVKTRNTEGHRHADHETRRMISAELGWSLVLSTRPTAAALAVRSSSGRSRDALFGSAQADRGEGDESSTSCSVMTVFGAGVAAGSADRPDVPSWRR